MNSLALKNFARMARSRLTSELTMTFKARSLESEMRIDTFRRTLANAACTRFIQFVAVQFMKVNGYAPNALKLLADEFINEDPLLDQLLLKAGIPESDWEDVEVIGWLYQYYISVDKQKVFANLKLNIKITKHEIPAATQLFTPRWIVHYLVENSLGRLWFESNPQTDLRSKWTCFLDEETQPSEAMKHLERIRRGNVNVEDITFFDPACGTGHILVYAFDLLYDMYVEQGYRREDIPKQILEKNLYGVDIDDQALKIASFALTMKAQEKPKGLLPQDIQLNLCTIEETDWLTDEVIDSVLKEIADMPNEAIEFRGMLEYFRDTFQNAKELGSTVQVKPLHFELLESRLQNICFVNNCFCKGEKTCDPETQGIQIFDTCLKSKLEKLLKQAQLLSSQYDVVCTNPPYMWHTGMNPTLASFVKTHYPDSKSDLFAVFMEVCRERLKPQGLQAMITQQSWMFLSSYEKLRQKLREMTLVNMVHLGAKAFQDIEGQVVQTTAFVLRNEHTPNYTSLYVRLVDVDGAQAKQQEFLSGNHRYSVSNDEFVKLPGAPMAYWVDKNLYDLYGGAAAEGVVRNHQTVADVADSFQGMITGDNSYYLRLWHEVNREQLVLGCTDMESLDEEAVQARWVPYNKGGRYRKWYGNNSYVLRWTDAGKGLTRSRSENRAYYFRQGVTWSYLTSSDLSARYFEPGFLWDVSGSSLFLKASETTLMEILAYLNSPVAQYILKATNPTVNFQVENILSLPFSVPEKMRQEIQNLTEENIALAKADWDDHETSWDFTTHPFLRLVKGKVKLEAELLPEDGTVATAWTNWASILKGRIRRIRANEEKLNRIFIETNRLGESLTPTVDEDHVSLRTADKGTDIKSFISHAVGCMFGRYSLDENGLVFAGGHFNSARYQSFCPTKHGIIPILTRGELTGDLVSRFVEFVDVTFGLEKRDENLQFIAAALGPRSGEEPRATIARYFTKGFYQDHLRIYSKRPIYWLFTSGKRRTFNCLIYLHRYEATTLSTMRSRFLQPLLQRLEEEADSLLSAASREVLSDARKAANKRLKSLQLDVQELRKYDVSLQEMAERKIPLDLDDGVIANYAKFTGLVVPIR